MSDLRRAFFVIMCVVVSVPSSLAWAHHRPCHQDVPCTGSVVLAWDASVSADVRGYRLHYGHTSRAYTQVVDVGNITQASIGGLPLRETYYFAATAYSTVESDYSNEVVVTLR